MIAFLTANMAPIMFASLILFLLFGYAVAFSLAACGLFFGLVGIELGMINPSFLQALPLRMFGIMQNDTLLAIPFFTFMGLILERAMQLQLPTRRTIRSAFGSRLATGSPPGPGLGARYFLRTWRRIRRQRSGQRPV